MIAKKKKKYWQASSQHLSQGEQEKEHIIACELYNFFKAYPVNSDSGHSN